MDRSWARQSRPRRWHVVSSWRVMHLLDFSAGTCKAAARCYRPCRSNTLMCKTAVFGRAAVLTGECIPLYCDAPVLHRVRTKGQRRAGVCKSHNIVCHHRCVYASPLGRTTCLLVRRRCIRSRVEFTAGSALKHNRHHSQLVRNDVSKPCSANENINCTVMCLLSVRSHCLTCIWPVKRKIPAAETIAHLSPTIDL